MKYVISDSEFTPVVVIGNNETSHTDLRKCFLNHVLGAGFFCIVNGRVHTYGKSEGLGIAPSPKDANLLECYLGLDDQNKLTEVPDYVKYAKK